jgi:hypothetical protein
MEIATASRENGAAEVAFDRRPTGLGASVKSLRFFFR